MPTVSRAALLASAALLALCMADGVAAAGAGPVGAFVSGPGIVEEVYESLCVHGSEPWCVFGPGGPGAVKDLYESLCVHGSEPWCIAPLSA